MKKECFAILLPTKDISKLAICYDGIKDDGSTLLEESVMQQPHINGGLGMFFYTQKAQYQHLYICSNEEIKEGDWYYFTKDNQIHKHLGIKPLHGHDSDKCFKIIATTDNNLKLTK